MSHDQRASHFHLPDNNHSSTIDFTGNYEVYKGSLFLKHKLKKKAWKEKYFVLYNDRTLSYWSKEYHWKHDETPKETIDLTLTQNIHIVDNKSSDEDHSIRGHSKSPSTSNSRNSRNSYSRKGSVDFGRIFSRANNRSHPDSDIEDLNGDRFIFRITTHKKQYTLSVEDAQHFKEWITHLEGVVFGNVLHKGYLFELLKKSKKEKKKQWVKRWFIAYDRKEVRYFNNPTKQIAFGVLVLSNLKTMSKSEDHKAKKKYGQLLYLIKLEFKKSVLILASLSCKERDLWYDTIFELLNPNPDPKPTEMEPKAQSKSRRHQQQSKTLLDVPCDANNTNPKTRSKSATLSGNGARFKKEVILPIPHKVSHALSPSNNSVSPSKQSMLSVLSTSSMSRTRSSAERGDPGVDVSEQVLMGLKKEIESLHNELLCLKIQNAMMTQNRQPVMECREEYVEDALLDCDQYLILDRNWRNWSYLEIVEWITNLEYGRYNKYKTVLFANMKHREMEGIYLAKLEKRDLSNFFGVINFADCCDLYAQIKKLIKM